MGEFGRPKARNPSFNRKRPQRDNPEIRHSHLEEQEINLAQEHEVEHAKDVGAIKVRKDPDGKSAAVEPVKGRTTVKDGKLYYDKEKENK